MFALDYAKNQQRRISLWLRYEGSEDEPIFTVAYDPDKQTSYLRPLTPESQKPNVSQWDWKIVPSVYAAQGIPASSKSPLPSINSSIDEKRIIVLQDPRSDVATKLNLIDALAAQDQQTLRSYLAAPLKEPFTLTLFDLTQHSDPELAAKATRLSQSLDIDGYLALQLASDNHDARASAENILLRISRGHALGILSRAGNGKYPDLKEIRDKIDSGQYTQVLKPTASLQGDRYYIKATWNPAQTEVLACLTKLFNSSLESSRSFAQEQALMAGKSERYVYWYDKQWVLETSVAIKQCGGTAEFVHPR